MVIVHGSAVLTQEHFDQGLALSQEHVARSRTEPGCIAHAVHRDTEQPLRLVFVERWADKAALLAHVQLPASRAFGRALAGLAAEPPEMQVYEASEVALR